MFTYGSQVNPSLLRQDFSPILQAAQAQAQATQQAAQIRAQSLANIGSTIGNAIQTYTQKQEQKKQKEAAVRTIGTIFENNPELAAGLKVPVDASGKPDRGAIEAVIKTFDSPADALKIASTLEELGVTRKARQQQEQAASYAAMLRQGGGQVPSPVSNQALAQFSPQARVAGEAAFLATEQARANLAKTKAEEAALRTPKANRSTGEEGLVQSRIAAWQALNPGKTIPPSEEARIREAARPKPATTTIKMPDTETATQVFNLMNAEREKAASAVRSLPAYAEVAKILGQNKGKDVYTGTGAEAKLFLAKALAPLGFDQTSANNTEVLRSQLAIPVLGLVKQLGAGAGISNADRDFAAKAAGGEITLNAEAIQRLSEIGQRASNALIEDYKQRLDEVYPEDEQESFRTRRALMLRVPTKNSTPSTNLGSGMGDPIIDQYLQGRK